MVLRLIFYFLLVKLGYFLVAYGCVRLNIPYPGDIYYKNINQSSFNDLLNIFGRWDYGWYRNIALNGYDSINFKTYFSSNQPGWKQTNWGFMPLYPMLLAFFNLFFLPEIGAFILNLLISFALVGALFFVAADILQNNQQAYFATILFIVFPFNFYYSCFLTEPLYLLLVLWVFYFLNREKWSVIGFLMMPLVILRPTGVFVLAIIYLAFLVKNKAFSKKFFDRDIMLKQGWFLLPVITFMCYMLYCYVNTGDAMAYVTAQKMGWNKQFVIPFKGLFTDGTAENQIQSAYIIFIWMVSIGYLFYNKDQWVLFLYLVLCSTLHLIGGNPDGAIRYISASFPLIFWLSSLLWSKRYFYRALTIVVLILAHYASFYLWLDNNKLTM